MLFRELWELVDICIEYVLVDAKDHKIKYPIVVVKDCNVVAKDHKFMEGLQCVHHGKYIKSTTF